MNSEKFQKIDRIYEGLLELSQSEHQNYLDKACEEDLELREEIESLLKFDYAENSFIDSSPDFLAAELISEQENLLGKTIDRYEIVSLLGRGGMGAVYLANDLSLERQVAIKFLPPAFNSDLNKSSRFIREAKAASALNHPNIITVHEINEFQGKQYIATEYIDGETLTEHTKSNNLSLNTSLDIATQIASALSEAHNAGIIHRDIKSDNIMVRPNGLVKILDFGIAKLTEQFESNSNLKSTDSYKKALSTADSTLNGNSTSEIFQSETLSGMLIGTVSYMSPEQAKGEKINTQTDIFSFGIVLYELLSGKLPFEGKTPLEIVETILHKEPEPLSDYEVPFQIERIINKCLEKNCNDRYQIAQDVVSDLENVKQNLAISDKSQSQKLTNKTRPRTYFQTKFLILLAVILTFVLGLSIYQYSLPEKQIESIAVMPFINESGNQNTEYISDGMTETLIRSLSNVSGISVKARSTVYHYKGKNVSPKQIGKELKVQAVLLGRVVQRGDNLQLNLELVNTETQDVLWTEQYNRQQADLVSLQSNIAVDILKKLTNKLSSENEKQLTKSYPQNSEAYKLYLQGRYFWNKSTRSGSMQALDYFQKAIELDPTFALAYVGLAQTIASTSTSDKPDFERVKKLALKAIELDDSLGEAHATIGLVFHDSERNWLEAERHYQKAIDLNPNYADAHQFYGELLMQMGKTDKSLSHFKKAVEIDPVTLPMHSGLGMAYFDAGQTEKAVEYLQRAIEKEPNFYKFHSYLARIYDHQGKYKEAITSYSKSYILLEKDEDTVEKYSSELRKALENSGELGYWQKRLEIHKNMPQIVADWQCDLANIYLNLNDTNNAFKEMEKSLKEKDFDLFYLKTIPEFKELSNNPRFINLLVELNFPK